MRCREYRRGSSLGSGVMRFHAMRDGGGHRERCLGVRARSFLAQVVPPNGIAHRSVVHTRGAVRTARRHGQVDHGRRGYGDDVRVWTVGLEAVGIDNGVSLGKR